MAKYPGPGATSSTLLPGNVSLATRRANALKSARDFKVSRAYHLATAPSIPKPLYGFAVAGIKILPQVIVVGSDGPPQCEIGECGFQTGECLAKARLVAARPDLSEDMRLSARCSVQP